MNLLEERSDMLLATYQPKEARSEHQNHQYDCFRDKLGGEYPVFCFPARSADEFRFRSLLAAPCKPECLIFFDADDYARFDAVTWNNILTLPRDADFDGKFAAMFDDVDERFSEYVVPQSRLKEKSYQCDAIHLGIPPRTPQGTRPLTRISGFTRTHPRRRAGKAGGLLSFTKRISREPPVNGLSRHILAKTPVFHAPVDSGSAPIMRERKAPF